MSEDWTCAGCKEQIDKNEWSDSCVVDGCTFWFHPKCYVSWKQKQEQEQARQEQAQQKQEQQAQDQESRAPLNWDVEWECKQCHERFPWTTMPFKTTGQSKASKDRNRFCVAACFDDFREFGRVYHCCIEGCTVQCTGKEVYEYTAGNWVCSRNRNWYCPDHASMCAK